MKRALTAALASLAVLLTPHTAGATSQTSQASQGRAGDLGAALDRLVPELLARDRIPGAAVVVVENGRMVFGRGYGLAETTSNRPVDLTTPFLTGSLAKIFTAEAALRLVRKGRLDLRADVNRYLTSFKIEDTWPGRPVTLENLLTYTAGFDDDIVGLASDGPAKPPSLAESLRARTPPRVRPPGTLVAYDNYALALTGHLVEIASGEPYARNVAEQVFAAHRMTGSTAALPHPAAIGARLARGYRPDGEGYVEQRGQYSPWTPSGTGPAVTPADMANYMIDQLGDDPVARMMRERHFTVDDRMPGMGYVLEERPRGGRRLLYKDGDVPGYHNAMALMPDQGFGVYVVLNGDGVSGVGAWDAQWLTGRIVDLRFPDPADRTATPAPLTTDVSRYAGSYRSARTSRTALTKVSALFATPVVTAGSDGTLTTTGLSPDPGRPVQHWVQTAPGLFAERSGPARVSFPRDGVLVSSMLPSETYERVPGYESLAMPLFVTGALALSLAALVLPLTAAVRRLRGARRPQGARPPLPARLAVLTAWACAALVAVFLAGFGLLTADPNVLMADIPLYSPRLAVLPVLGTLALVLAVPMVPAAALAWRARWWRPPARIAYTLLTLSTVAFFAVALDFRLLLL
ncbi:serine hydrolase domain-containing protein [Streptosporangium sp. NPDC000239]|uniref:serine hydrolase domain-containing protein n=1 Tax=Streptosporangium sp. NPDC000239 TaxID=3154248 RepID=UPI0033194F37